MQRSNGCRHEKAAGKKWLHVHARLQQVQNFQTWKQQMAEEKKMAAEKMQNRTVPQNKNAAEPNVAQTLQRKEATLQEKNCKRRLQQKHSCWEKPARQTAAMKTRAARERVRTT